MYSISISRMRKMEQFDKDANSRFESMKKLGQIIIVQIKSLQKNPSSSFECRFQIEEDKMFGY